MDVSSLEDSLGIPRGLYAKLLSKGEASGSTATSPKGAYGTAQLMPGTAADMGVDRYDPDENLYGGAKYLSMLLKRYHGDQNKAVEAYNEGPGRADRGIVLPETAAYVRRVTGADVVPNAGTDTAPNVADFAPQLKQLLGLAGQDPLYQSAVQASKKASAASDDENKSLDEWGQKLGGIEGQIGQIKAPQAPNAPTLPGEKDYQDRALKGVSDKPMDPMRVMGQFLPMLAILGGAFTKNSAIGSLKSAAAAMNAARQNDKDALERAHQQWLDDTTKLTNQYKLEQDAFQDAISSNGEKRANLQADLSVLAAQYKIPILQAANAAGDMDRAKQLIAARQASLDPFLTLQQAAVEDEFRRKGLKIEEEKIPLATQVFNSWLEAHPGDQDGALKAAGEAAREVRAGSLQAEYSDENKIRTELVKPGTPTAAYQAIKINGSKLQDAAEHPENYISPAGSAIVADTFTQAFNGGKAIRGFQAKMLSDDRTLSNEIQSILQRASTGGKFTPQEIKSMANAVLRITPDLKQDFQQAASDAINLARSRGEDPHSVIPFGLHDDVDFGADTGTDPTADAGPAPGGTNVPPPPLPAKKSDLVVNTIYQTSRGPAKWDGSQFEAVPGYGG